MEKWEYLSQFLYANIDNPGAQELLRHKWPGQKHSKYSPRTMIPELNRFGEEGWELVHMEPIAGVGKEGTVHGTPAGGSDSNAYFCVFKRRTPE